MAKNGFWSGFMGGVLAAAGAGLGIWVVTHLRSAFASRGGERDRQFSMSSPRPNDSVRRDILEADGAVLESIRGGAHKMDRSRIDADKREIHSPANPPGYTHRERSTK